MKNRRVLAAWEEFRRAVFHRVPPENVNLLDLKIAFFGGASAYYSIVMRGLDPSGEPTEADEQMLEDIGAELKEFALEIKRLGDKLEQRHREN